MWWLVPYRSQGMLTQGLAPDPKCKLKISSFYTRSHPLDCFICAKDIIILVLLLQMMGGWEGFAVFHFCYGLVWGTVGWYYVSNIFSSVFVLLLIILSWLVYDNYVCFVCFFLFFAFFDSGPIN